MIDPALLAVTALAVTLAAMVHGREFLRLRWDPTRHTVAAVAVGLLAAAFSALALTVPRHSFAYAFILWIDIFGLCGFTLPWAYVLLVEGGSPADLGVRREGWARSLVVSLLFAAGSAYGILQHADLSRYAPSHLLGAVLALNVGGLFELFLYYGFVHLRLRDAFGPLPAIVGTAVIYSLWHVGTELPMHADPLAALGMLFVVGVLCQSVFAITYNVLVVWPFFFTAGVMHDFILNLDLPQQIGAAWGWTLVGWTLALGVPWSLWRHGRRAAPRAGV